MFKLNGAAVDPIGPRQARRGFDPGIEGLGKVWPVLTLLIIRKGCQRRRVN